MATVFVTLSNADQWWRALKTIRQIRGEGSWAGDICFIAIDFNPPANDIAENNIIVVSFPRIDTVALLEAIGPGGFSRGDGREINKIIQWEKFHVFDDYFKAWRRIVYLDAGIRVCGPVAPLLELDYEGKFLAPPDATAAVSKSFAGQLEERTPYFEALVAEISAASLALDYFLNCMWLYDTKCLELFSKQDLIHEMNTYPIFLCNEMGAMNVVIRFKRGLWARFPVNAGDKYLFEWSELNRPGTSWNNFIFLKYSVT